MAGDPVCYKIHDKIAAPKIKEMIPNNLYVLSEAELRYQSISSSYRFFGIKNIIPPSMTAMNPITLITQE